MIKILILKKTKGYFKSCLLISSLGNPKWFLNIITAKNPFQNVFFFFTKSADCVSYPLVDVSLFIIHDSGWLVVWLFATISGKVFLNHDRCQGQHCITKHYITCVV